MIYPLGHNEAKRLQVLHDLALLKTPPDPVLDRAVALARDLFQVPIAVVTLIDAHEQWFKAQCGIAETGTPRDQAFCNWTILSDDVFVVEDASQSLLFKDNPLVKGDAHIRFYAGAPLSLDPGLRLGALCVIDTKPRSFSDEDRRRLSDLAAMVVGQLQLHRYAINYAKQATTVWHLANQDPLTGLANRSFFQQRLEEVLARTLAQNTSASLLLIDLDNFKDVNDALGHDAGDSLLSCVAMRLGEFVRESDAVARLGGDEFGIILSDPFEPDQAYAIAGHMLARLAEPFSYGGHIINCRASVGISTCPRDHCDASELLKDADLALYRAKALGRNAVTSYVPEMRQAVESKIVLGSEITYALAEGRIVPYYQPKICLATGAIVGFEALARWRHPSRGLLTPGVFGAVFDDPEHAREIGRRILEQVAADLRSWLAQGLDCGHVAVNFCSAEFMKPELATEALTILEEAGVPPSRLEVEVTENVFLGRHLEYVTHILTVLHKAGVTIALDDFGTGFASLTHLKQFPVDHIKIDQSFIRDLNKNADSAAIVAAMVGLGKSLKIHVTAEGVETAEQAKLLENLGCDQAQGYLYAKPMPGSRVPWMLRNWIKPPAKAGRRQRA